jgi:hypothetical protein
VPKDTAYVHRNLSLLFRYFAPVYQEPEVFVLTPDCHRLGGAKWLVIDGVLACIDLALGTHVHNLGMLNEAGLAIPPSARVLFYPIPYCLSDDTCARLRAWVEQGGVLYLSGDLAYDEQRRASRPGRLEELCGVRRLSALRPPLGIIATNTAAQPAIGIEVLGATVRRQAPDGSPALVEHRVGRGRVIYTPDPVELHSTSARRAEDVALYRQVLAWGGVRPLGVEPNAPDLLVYKVPLRDQGAVWIIANRDESQTARAVTLTDTPAPVTVELAGRRPGLLWFDGAGALRAVETRSDCRLAGGRIVRDETGGILFTLDGRSLARSQAVVLLPLEAGRVTWATEAAWDDPWVETGEFQNGEWRVCEHGAAAGGRTEVEVAVKADQVLSVLLVGERTALPRWRRALERAMTDPGGLP